jgi:hypothetical protein
MKRFLSQLFGANKSASRRPAAPQARPGVECLEGRLVLSPTVIYDVTVESDAARRVMEKTIKKNILTLKNLAPGNYTVSCSTGEVVVNKVIAKNRPSPVAHFTIDPD